MGINTLAFNLVRIILLGIFSACLTFILTPLWTNILYKYRLGKHIREDKDAPIFMSLHQKKEGTPTMGGVLIWGGVLIVTFLFFFLAKFFNGFWGKLNFVSRSQTWLPLAAMTGAAFVGLIDDLMGVFRIGPKGGGLRMRDKIIVYILIAMIGAWWFTQKLEYQTVHFPLIGDINLGVFYFLFFVFILVATTFSANETDGLDGLLAGTALVVLGCLLVVAFVKGKYELSAFLATFIGALTAFLWFNIYPARFFMGDTGAMAIGITVGVIAMLTDTSLYLPFFAFIWVIESLSVIIQKIYKKIKKKKLFLSTPIHHHFEAIGWPETKVTMRFWIISAVVGLFGLALYFLDIFVV
ncbi:MAG TPA: phospho-N-acetylmuramoyl-pentapeptide-transferase [Candidatus Paceibacterota bacterium]|nr:phospho-N-acetylmuramoyl-pentapeptide-transferase [Candidatus Paceibacterota bacterium]